MDAMLNVHFTVSSNNKDEHRDLYNYLNQKLIGNIDTLDGSTLWDNLIMNHQVDYMSAVLIPVEAVENDQEHPEFLVFFTFINFFMKKFINQNHSLLSDCAFGPFT